VWEWFGSVDTNWSNSGNWMKNGAAPVGGQYPGQPGSGDQDRVLFNQVGVGAAVLNAGTGMGPIATLEITTTNTLTLNQNLTVQRTDGQNGQFLLTNNTTVTLANNVFLALTGLQAGVGNDSAWTRGTITGGTGSSLMVLASHLWITQSAGGLGVGGLGTNMVIQGGPGASKVTLTNMVNNLTLTGTDNTIRVANGGRLELSQQIVLNGQQNTRGGIAFGAAHTGKIAVVVDSGGVLDRGSVPIDGVPNQVSIAGAVYNMGGTVSVGGGSMLNITGQDAGGISYFQQFAATGLLTVGIGGNIKAAGTFQISAGTVKFTATSGGSTEALEGAGLLFLDNAVTSLIIVDSDGAPGTVVVRGPVTLGQNTITKMSYKGGNNTADLLEVKDGTLTLKGRLELTSLDLQKPGQPLNFFADSGPTPSIVGAFTTITGNLTGTYTGQVVTSNPQLKYFQVTIT
jgi:hypothetical protein